MQSKMVTCEVCKIEEQLPKRRRELRSEINTNISHYFK